MRKKLVVLLTIGFVAALLLPIPSQHAKGVYNRYSGLIWCSDRSSCLHEIGHKLDQKAGYPSKDGVFGLALRMYLNDELKKPQASEIALGIFNFPGAFSYAEGSNRYTSWTTGEIYASMFAWADGKEENMPEQFRHFYNWSLGEYYAR